MIFQDFQDLLKYFKNSYFPEYNLLAATELKICMKSMIKAATRNIPAGNYMFKVNNRNTRARCEICSRLTIKAPERRQWPRSGVFIVNFEPHSLTALPCVPLLREQLRETGSRNRFC